MAQSIGLGTPNITYSTPKRVRRILSIGGAAGAQCEGPGPVMPTWCRLRIRRLSHAWATDCLSADRQHWTRGKPYYPFGHRTEHHVSPSCEAVGGDYDQVHFLFVCNSNDFIRGIASQPYDRPRPEAGTGNSAENLSQLALRTSVKVLLILR